MSEFDPKLSQLKRIQLAFDNENFSGADTSEGKRRHIYLHIGKLMGKFSEIEEQADHGHIDTSRLRTDIVPDLLVFAAQLSELEGIDMGTALKERYEFVAERNATGVDSAHRAMQTE